MKLWKNFGLSLGFCLLFFLSWIGHGITQWQQFTDEQLAHGEQPEMGDFVAEFGRATLENWQSEFLQLFSFTVMSAVLIHKGSNESRDGSDRIESALMRIEEKLDTAPARQGAPSSVGDKDLHVLPDGFEGWALQETSSSEPEGYYDTQEEAIAGGRELATRNGVTLHIHGQDGKVRDQADSSS